jgi:hypothetical protein
MVVASAVRILISRSPMVHRMRSRFEGSMPRQLFFSKLARAAATRDLRQSVASATCRLFSGRRIAHVDPAVALAVFPLAVDK